MKVDYSKAFIYKLCCLDPNITECYVGCSTDFKTRVQSHKRRCCNENDSKHHYKVYQFIRGHGGWDNWRLVVLHDFPCANKRELEKEETRVMIELKAELNARVSFTTHEERLKRDKLTKQKKLENVPGHREKVNEGKRASYQRHKESIAEKGKEKVECPFCKNYFRKDSLPRHQRGAAYCIEIQKR